MDALIDLDAVLRHVSLGRSKLYQLVKAGTFPKPIKISPQRRAWLASEIEAWIQARAAEREEPQP